MSGVSSAGRPATGRRRQGEVAFDVELEGEDQCPGRQGGGARPQDVEPARHPHEDEAPDDRIDRHRVLGEDVPERGHVTLDESDVVDAEPGDPLPGGRHLLRRPLHAEHRAGRPHQPAGEQRRVARAGPEVDHVHGGPEPRLPEQLLGQGVEDLGLPEEPLLFRFPVGGEGVGILAGGVGRAHRRSVGQTPGSTPR